MSFLNILIIVIVVVLVLLLLGFFFYKKVYTTRVDIVNNAFEPSQVSIRKNTQVIWKNQGKQDHNVTADHAPDTEPLFASKILKPGQSFSHTFKQNGHYPYYCELHPLAMRGVVNVS